VKNKNTSVNTNEGFFVLQTALKQIANNIDLNGLLKVVLKTENPELATRMLAGVYRTPNLPKQVILQDNKNVGDAVCSLIEYNPWDNMVSFSYEKNKKVYIYVDKNCDAVITADNYQEYRKSWSDGTKSVTVTLPEMERATDSVSLETWMAASIVGNEDEFDYTSEFTRKKQEDIF
jgi:hypothetical protein